MSDQDNSIKNASPAQGSQEKGDWAAPTTSDVELPIDAEVET